MNRKKMVAKSLAGKIGRARLSRITPVPPDNRREKTLSDEGCPIKTAGHLPYQMLSIYWVVKINSDTGNRTRVSTVRAWCDSPYTISDFVEILRSSMFLWVNQKVAFFTKRDAMKEIMNTLCHRETENCLPIILHTIYHSNGLDYTWMFIFLL